MAKAHKICFVIMGFGKKTDFSTGKTLDLDKTYKNIIHPAVGNAGFQCIRADEIQDSGIIDRSMYALLMHADLVIADISTYNPNVIYELGIRHAVKPFTTIILKEKEGKIPFDIDHTRIFKYSHLGEDIGFDEVNRCVVELSDLIKSTIKSSFIDSPLYSHISGITPPELPTNEYKRIIEDLAEKEKHIFAIVEQAKEFMDNSQFKEAKKFWEKACRLLPTENYFVQQLALAVYKSEYPTPSSALLDALSIIKSLDPDGDINDPETLGITGSIYKRMWVLDKDIEYLNRAIKYYEKGYAIRSDYYTGENLALCLNMRGEEDTSQEERIYHTIAAKKIREKIICMLEEIVNDKREIERPDKKWIYATLSNCNYALNNMEDAEKYEELFSKSEAVVWEVETFNLAKKQLVKLIKQSI